MVGKRPNNAEKGMIMLMKCLGFKQGDIKKTGVIWNKRSIKRANLGSGDFFNNCVWGSFKNPHGEKRMFEMDIAFPDSFLDIEIDGSEYHMDYYKDKERDKILKYNGWSVIRINTDCVYSVFIPMLNDYIKKRK